MTKTYIAGLNSVVDITKTTDVNNISISSGVLRTDGQSLYMYDNEEQLFPIAGDLSSSTAIGISYDKNIIIDRFLVTSGSLQNALRSYTNSALEPYFSNFGLYYQMKSFSGADFTDRALPHIKKMLDQVVLPRLDSTAYVENTFIHTTGYVWRCTTAGTTAGSAPTFTGTTVNDGTVVWTREIGHATNHTAYQMAYTNDLSALKKQDSDDSTMSSILCCAGSYIQNTGDKSWLPGASNNGGRSYQAIIDAMWTAFQALIVVNNLPYVFQQNTDPVTGASTSVDRGDGVLVPLQYAADSAEVLLGAKIAKEYYRLIGDKNRYDQAETMRSTLVTGINGLWSTDHFLYFFGDLELDTSTAAVTARWYAQALVMLYMDDDELSYDRRLAATTYMNNAISDWWYRTSDNPHASLLPLLYMLEKGNDLQKVQDGIRILEQDYFVNVTNDLVILDTALYLYIKQKLLGRQPQITYTQPTTANFVNITASTYTASDISVIYADATSNAITITLPAVASVVDRVYYIKKIDSSVNSVTIDGNSSETIDGSTTNVLSSQYDSVTIHSNGNQWFILS